MVRNWIILASIVSIGLVAAAPSALAQPPEKKPILDQSPLLKEPKTPEEMFAATLLMVDLARLDLAARYLEQFDATNPDDEMLIKLRDKYGTGDFLRLAQIKELQPRSNDLLERLNAAAKKQVDDPAFVDALIQRLTQGPTKRDLAIIELRNAGPRVVPEILKQMARPEMADEQDTLVITLTRLGRQVIPPLIGALDSPTERIQAAVIDALGWLDATEAIPYLWYPAFDEKQPNGVRIAAKRVLSKLLKGSPERANQLSSVDASNELRRLAKLMYRKLDLLPVDDQGSVPLWAWDETDNTLKLRTYPPEIASLLVSTRFARQALALSPEQPETQRQYLASLLGLEVSREGWEKPRLAPPGSAMYLALTAGESTMSQVLSEALEAGHPTTAVAALEVLSQIGTREQLLPQRGLKSPVLAALNSPDQRVQFAAATTILKLEPKNGFSGATRIVSILARALTDPVQPRAIVIDADGQRARATADFLNDSGYEGVTAATGREGFELAATTAGVEVIVVQVNCLRWDLSQTLANLRADARTAAIPIVIYGPATLRDRMSRQVARTAPATFVAESATTGDFLGQFQPFLKNLKSPPLSPVERDLEKKAAIYWLATIGTSNSLSKLFDISRAEKELTAAVEDPDIAMNALTALGSIPTATAQRRIADVALNTQVDPLLREAAAGQLAYHIQHHGLLLGRNDVIEVHDGWKRTDNPAVKSALASVIGSLKPNATIVGERLQQFPVPQAN
jgi:CheY-like chemotaxis protein